MLKKYLQFTASFFIFLLIIALIFFAFYIDFGQGAAKKAGTASEILVFEESDSINVLIIVVNDNKKADTIMLAHVDAVNLLISVKLLDMQEKFRYYDGEKTLSELYDYASVDAVNEAYKLKHEKTIDRYIKLSYNDLSDIIDILGGIYYDITEYIDHKEEDFPLKLYAGRQYISGNKAVALIKYNIAKGNEQIKPLIFKEIINQNIAKAEQKPHFLFLNIINKIKTDMGISDKEKYKPLIMLLAKKEDPCIIDLGCVR